MSNYTKTTDFAAKDSLTSGNASKAVKGAEIDAEFNAIATSSATKADKTMTGVFALYSGAAATPGLAFASDTATGFFLSGTSLLGIAIGGVQSVITNANRGWTFAAAASGATITVSGPASGPALNISSGTLQFGGSVGAAGTFARSTGSTGTPAWSTLVLPNSATTGDLLYASSTNTIGNLAGVATGNALISGGVGVAPSWGKIVLTTHVSGTLAVANGGTGVTSSTGSGNNVLSTSPTLVTPVLGTPTSGTLTNCTGLPLTTGITGTLGVSNGGTGVTSSTGSGSNVLSTSPTLVTPILGTPTSGTLTNCTGLPIAGISGTGTGVATALAAAVTGSGSIVLGTSPTITTPTIVGATFTGNAQTTPSAVTFSATAMTVNCALSNVFTTTFTANVTTAPSLSNAKDGQTINWFITQDATGSRTMTWPTSFKWPGGVAGVLSTAANSVDLLVATYRASTGFWYASLSKAFS